MIELSLALGLLGPPATAPQTGDATVGEAQAPAPEAPTDGEAQASAPADLGELEALPELEPLPELPELDALPELPELDSLPELPDTGGSSLEDGPTSAAVPEEDPGLRLGDVMTGSVRLVGAYLHFDDIPELYPGGDDGLFSTVARVMVDRDFDHRFSLELNYFADLTRSPTVAGGTGGAFGTAGSTDSVYRSPFLAWTLWEDGSIRGGAGVDRFAGGAKLGPVTMKVGRFPISHSVTSFFTPNDFLAPFSVTAVNRIYKPGVDAVQIGTALGMIGSVEVMGVLGNDVDGDPRWSRSALLARASVVGGGFEWAALGGKVAERWVVGGSFQGGIGAFGLHGEGHLGVPDTDGDGRGSEDTEPLHVRLAAGPSLNIGWKGLNLGAEYAFYSDGANRASGLLDRATRLFPDDVPLLGRHYVGAVAGMELIPILQASVLTLVNANDGSGLTGLSLIYSVADEADLIAGAFVPWGADPSLTGDPLMPLALGSELGASPFSLYLEARTFF
ncbi:MAG: hypothetical protein AAF799_34690 [Myxococcota bacterium]